MTSFSDVWRRRHRALLARRFAEQHALNRLLWSAPAETWPEMALSGPWAGIAEDLSKEAFTAESLDHETPKPIFHGSCWKWPMGGVPCTPGCAWVSEGACTHPCTDLT